MDDGLPTFPLALKAWKEIQWLQYDNPLDECSFAAFNL